MITRRKIFESAFPFYILLDHDLTVKSVGRSLLKLGFDPHGGPGLADFFHIKRPAVALDFATIAEHSSTVFILEAVNGKISLKGQMLEVGYHGKTELAFLGSPIMQSLEDVEAAGLKMSDFALHESSLDFLVLMQIQANVHNDTKRLADQLLEETKARRKAQEVLEQTNLSLENTVQQRTEELSRAKGQLEGFVERLHASNTDLRVLNEVDEALHRCQTVEEAFPTVVKAVKRLFPESSGRISCLDDGADCFRVKAQWGEAEHHLDDTFDHDDCPAMAEQTVFFGHGPRTGSGCAELKNIGDKFYYCRPLRFAGVTMGLFHFHYGMSAAYDDQEEWQQSRHALASTLAEHMAMGLSNIRLRQKLEEESIRDPMTRLFNRRYMLSILEQEVDRAGRDATDAFGLIMLDVDHFKEFNDRHGHQAGDHVLVQLAHLLASQVRKGDVACRYGGEEFLLILRKSSLEDTVRRAEAIRQTVAESGIDVAGNLYGITVSSGVSGFQPGDDIDTVVRRADDALYEAKRQGRNRVVVW